MRQAATRVAATAARRASSSAPFAPFSSSSAWAAPTSAAPTMPALASARMLSGWAGPTSPPPHASARPAALCPPKVPRAAGTPPSLLLSARLLHPPPTAAFANLPGGVPNVLGGVGGGRAGEGGAAGGADRPASPTRPALGGGRSAADPVRPAAAGAAAAAAASAAWDAGSSSAYPPPPPPPLGSGGGGGGGSGASSSQAGGHPQPPFSTTPDDDASHFESPAERAALARELHTVTVAISANAAIFVAKMAAWAATGSAAMLAEGIHSAVDTFNQALLRVGVVRSRRAPTAAHPYGYMKDKFVWSLVSACGIFCLGAGANVMHGLQALGDSAHGPAPSHLGWALSVLGVSALVEGYSLAVAVRSVAAGAAAAGLPFREYVARGVDPTSVAVMLEDGAAVAGLGIAAVATLATAATGSGVPDACGSLAVGLLMGVTAVFLIGQNRSLLIGRAMHPVDMQRVLNHLARDPVVRAVFDAKSEEIGPGKGGWRMREERQKGGGCMPCAPPFNLGGRMGGGVGGAAPSLCALLSLHTPHFTPPHS